MILVDDRVGSRELLQGLRALGIDCDLGGKLEADFQFSGNGADGLVLIGIERKTISDLLQSMRDKRLAGQQVGRMVQTYDVRYLIVEGVWRRGADTGLIEVPNGQSKWLTARGTVKYTELDRFLCSLSEIADMRLWRTYDERETCAAIADRYLWWQKQWHEHRTGQTIYAAVPERRSRKPSVFRTEASLLEKWMCQLPGVDDRAVDLAKHFKSPYALAAAGVDDWMQIKGLRMGKRTAEKIVNAIRNGSAD